MPKSVPAPKPVRRARRAIIAHPHFGRAAERLPYASRDVLGVRWGTLKAYGLGVYAGAWR